MSIVQGKCSGNCDPQVPVWSFDDCITVKRGQIERIYLLPVDAPDFTNADQLAEWTTRLSNTVLNDITKIRTLTVMAESPAASGDPIELSDNRKQILWKTRTITGKIDDNTDENYEAMRWIECNPNFKFYYSNGVDLYGSSGSMNEGILGFFQINEVIPMERKGIKTLDFTIIWEDLIAPTRFLNPMA